MLKSNINITSNIYIRNSPELRNDLEYVQKITGAKRLRSIQSAYFGLQSIPFTSVQKNIVSGNQVCSAAKNGEMSYGPATVDGTIKWVNRCEYTACARYDRCLSLAGAEPMQRSSTETSSSDEESDLRDFFRKLGIQIQEDTVIFERDRNRSKLKDTEECDQTYTPPAEQSASEVKEAGNQYQLITTPDCIIHAPLESHIILNSGPGTGKTYTIIQRLIYLLEQDMCSAEEIYILCYTFRKKSGGKQAGRGGCRGGNPAVSLSYLCSDV